MPRRSSTVVLRVAGRRIGPAVLAETVAALRAGGVAVFPTDTVYGIGAGIFRPTAIRRIFRLKGRSTQKRLPFLASGLEQALALVEPPDRRLRRLLAKHWPGPLTVVFRTSDLGKWATGGKDTVALRIPDHPVTLAILRAMGQPLAVTSANRSGGPEAVTGRKARALFDGKADVIVDGGRCPGGVASTVVDVSSAAWTLVREGAVKKRDLLRFLE